MDPSTVHRNVREADAGEPKRLETWRLGAFASTFLGVGGLGLPIVVFLPSFYATSVGLSLSVVGLIFMVTRFWDIVTDPVAGALYDKYRDVIGRKRALLLALPVLMATIYLLFPPEGASALYLTVALLIFYLAWTVANICITAWSGDLSNNYNERTRIRT